MRGGLALNPPNKSKMLCFHKKGNIINFDYDHNIIILEFQWYHRIYGHMSKNDLKHYKNDFDF